MTYGFFPRKTDSNERERMWHIYTLHLRAWELEFSSSSFFSFALSAWRLRNTELNLEVTERVSLIRRWFLKAAYNTCDFWKRQSSTQPPLRLWSTTFPRSELLLTCHIVSTVIKPLADGFHNPILWIVPHRHCKVYQGPFIPG